jgi:hypothetical protein
LKSAGIPGYLSAFISKMEREGLSPLVVDTLAYYYNKIVHGETGLISDRYKKGTVIEGTLVL